MPTFENGNRLRRVSSLQCVGLQHRRGVDAVLGQRLAAQVMPEKPELDESAPEVEVLPTEPQVPVATSSRPRFLRHQHHRIDVVAADEAQRFKAVCPHQAIGIAELPDYRVHEGRIGGADRT